MLGLTMQHLLEAGYKDWTSLILRYASFFPSFEFICFPNTDPYQGSLEATLKKFPALCE
jgi:hypothetical protein